MQVVMCITGAGATLLVLTGAIFRYVFKIDFFGAEEILTLLAFWLYFIGGAYGSYEDSHISADVVNSFVKNEKVLKILAIIKYSLSTVISAVVTYWAINHISWLFETNPKTSVFKIPVVANQICILVCFVLTTVYMLMHLIMTIKDSNTNKEEGAE